MNMTPPTSNMVLHVFLVLMDYHLDMWVKRSRVFKPLTILTSKNIKFKWTNIEQNNLPNLDQ